MVLVISYQQSITIIGLLYFLGEIIVVCGLVFVELRILKAAEQKKNIHS
jgi:hypothetical protein